MALFLPAKLLLLAVYKIDENRTKQIIAVSVYEKKASLLIL